MTQEEKKRIRAAMDLVNKSKLADFVISELASREDRTEFINDHE